MARSTFSRGDTHAYTITVILKKSQLLRFTSVLHLTLCHCVPLLRRVMASGLLALRRFAHALPKSAPSPPAPFRACASSSAAPPKPPSQTDPQQGSLLVNGLIVGTITYFLAKYHLATKAPPDAPAGFTLSGP